MPAKKSAVEKNVFVKVSSFFFTKWKLTLAIWLAILIAGATVYTSVIKREGFPPIQFPLTFIQGTYFTDGSQVDTDVTQKLSQSFLELPEVTDVQTTAGDGFFTSIVFFENTLTAEQGTQLLEDTVTEQQLLPEGVQPQYVPVNPAGFLNEYDLLLSVYTTNSKVSAAELDEVAASIASQLEADPEIKDVEPQNLVTESLNPATGMLESNQTGFNYYGFTVEEGQDLAFFKSTTIGLKREGNLDVIELSEYVNELIRTIEMPANYGVLVSADFADSIKTQIGSLQGNLLTGLMAVAIISFLFITWRASIITGLFMITVTLLSILVLYAIGYTLNTITLFALVLALGLFVDDATIIVEALDANKSKRKKPLQVAKDAIRKVASASFAGSLTTVLVFIPLAFISGILGEFIRIMPITVIVALVCSLTLSLTLIPFLSRFLILGRKTSEVTKLNPLPRLEQAAAHGLASLIRMVHVRPKVGKAVGVGAGLVSLVFIVLAVFFFGKLSFNIFPPSDDSDQIALTLNFPQGYSVEQAEQLVAELNRDVITPTLGSNVKSVAYGFSQNPNARVADAYIELTPFNTRDVKAPELVELLESELVIASPDSAEIKVQQLDAGPPSEDFPFKVQVYNEDQAKAAELAEDIRAYITGVSVTRANGTTATITEVKPVSTATIQRDNGRQLVVIEAAFDADDTSALLVAAEEYVSEKFDEQYLLENGYAADSLGFDFGQESDNADSFASLSYVFPIALLAMFILLALQFRSLLQPLLIFMAIPFSLLGVALGLYALDNSLSFFVQVGMIGLIGIAVNNTILLTDYANQERRSGKNIVDSIAEATRKRFRPLLTTSVTTVAALLPLALSDPFWEALAFTIIFGLLSSTFLVIVSFPYYYMLAEKMRITFGRVRGLAVLAGLVGSVVLSVYVAWVFIFIAPALMLYVIVKSVRYRS